jgi:hypothetical protein
VPWKANPRWLPDTSAPQWQQVVVAQTMVRFLTLSEWLSISRINSRPFAAFSWVLPLVTCGAILKNSLFHDKISGNWFAVWCHHMVFQPHFQNHVLRAVSHDKAKVVPTGMTLPFLSQVV